jgi:hypothetical protein
MSWWNEKALTLVRNVRRSEAACEDINVYSPSQVRTAVVHTQDVVGLCSQVSSLNQSLHWIFGVLVLNAAILAYIAFRLTP